ncbi:MAG TPA: response regulator [Candidatus Binatia bacterium]|nr:response regulator [Candidatus Binatia bacterium]
MSKVLVVDDNDDLRSLLVLLLQRYGGYDTLAAATGEEAVAKAIAGQPDLIIMDISLPDISGIGAIRELKNIQARPGFQLLPTLVCLCSNGKS